MRDFLFIFGGIFGRKMLPFRVTKEGVGLRSRIIRILFDQYFDQLIQI